MKKQTTVLVLGALLAVVMTAPSFAAKSTAHHAANRANATSSYSGYYDSAVPEGGYGYSPSYQTGGFSGAIGGIGR
jgi:uncharacterized membrane protein